MPRRSRVADTVLHPVRMKIIQQLGGRQLTTAQLRERLPEVTQATLYRHIAALVDEGFVAVVGERRVRGAVERTLALGDRAPHVGAQELRELDADALRAGFVSFLADLGAGFDAVLDSDDPEVRELLGFGRGAPSLYVDRDDLAAIQEGLAALLAPYQSPRTDGARRVSLATVLLPEVDGPASDA